MGQPVTVFRQAAVGAWVTVSDISAPEFTDKMKRIAPDGLLLRPAVAH